MKGEGTPDRVDNRLHQHFSEIFVGTGAQTEFFLSRRIESEDFVHVYVGGSRYRPDSRGTAYDFKIRGVTSGYAGEKNAIKFAIAPANLANIVVDIIV